MGRYAFIFFFINFLLFVNCALDIFEASIKIVRFFFVSVLVCHYKSLKLKCIEGKLESG